MKQGTGRELVKIIAPSFFTRRQAAGSGPAPGGSSPGAGHAAEFNRLIVPHLDGAYNLARYLSRDPTLAEDVVQDAMVRAFRAFRSSAEVRRAPGCSRSSAIAAGRRRRAPLAAWRW